MGRAEITALLGVPVGQLGFSQDFNRACERMGLHSLQEILDTPPEALVKKEGFSYTWLKEVTAFFSGHQAADLLQR